MKRKKIFIIFIFIVSKTLIAQSIYFNNRYDFFNGNKDLGNSIAVSDSVYIVACSVGDASLNMINLGLLSINKFGIVLWTKIYGQSDNYYYPAYNTLLKLMDGNYIVAGQMSISSGQYNSFLTKFNPIGDTLWLKIYQDSIYNNSTYQIKQTIDGGFLMVGTTNSVNSNYDVLLQKTDSSGNLLWQKNYGVPILTDEGWSIDICTNGDYLIGGYRINSSNIAINYILRTNSLGVLKWDTLFNLYGDVFVIATPDNGFVAATVYEDSVYNSNAYEKLWVLKFDSLGHVSWQKQYGDARFLTEAYSINRTNNGGFVITGSTSDINNHIMGFIARIDSIGDSIWYRNYDIAQYVNSQNYLTDIKQTPDGGFIACGYVFPQAPDTGTQDIWVLKVDSMGCEVPWCLGTGINELPVIKTEVKIFPNPANTVINISIPNYTPNETLLITNVLGEVIHQETLNGMDNSIDVSKWSAGVYFYLLLSDKETYRGKFIKQ